jgi:hypothetical protein
MRYLAAHPTVVVAWHLKLVLGLDSHAKLIEKSIADSVAIKVHTTPNIRDESGLQAGQSFLHLIDPDLACHSAKNTLERLHGQTLGVKRQFGRLYLWYFGGRVKLNVATFWAVVCCNRDASDGRYGRLAQSNFLLGQYKGTFCFHGHRIALRA